MGRRCLLACAVALAAATVCAGESLLLAASFERWLRRTGATLRSSATIVPAGQGDGQPGARLRITAKQRIPEGAELLRVPLPFVIWRGAAVGPSLPPAARKCIEIVIEGFTVAPGDGPPKRGARLLPGARPTDCGLALFLAAHAALGPDSPWHAFIESLPSRVLVPSSFSASALEALQDLNLASQARQTTWSRKAVHRQLGYAMHHIAKAIRARLRKSGRKRPSRSSGSLATFTWALSIVEARALSLRGEKFLVPGADLIGYEPHTVRAAAQGARFLRFHKIEPSAAPAATAVGAAPRSVRGQAEAEDFVILADHDIEPGAMVTEDYGDVPSHTLFQHHGFLPDRNAFDCARVDVPEWLRAAVSSGAPFGERRLTEDFVFPAVSGQRAQQLASLNVQLPSRACLRPGTLPQHVLAVLAYVAAPIQVLDDCNVNLLSNSDCVSAALEAIVQQDGSGHELRVASWARLAVAALARRQLHSFSSTIAADESMIRAANACSGHNSSNICVRMADDESAAIKFRLSRKHLLLATAQYFESPSTSLQHVPATGNLTASDTPAELKLARTLPLWHVKAETAILGDRLAASMLLFATGKLANNTCISASTVSSLAAGVPMQMSAESARSTSPIVGGGDTVLEHHRLDGRTNSQRGTLHSLAAILLDPAFERCACGFSSQGSCPEQRQCAISPDGNPLWMTHLSKLIMLGSRGGWRGYRARSAIANLRRVFVHASQEYLMSASCSVLARDLEVASSSHRVAPTRPSPQDAESVTQRVFRFLAGYLALELAPVVSGTDIVLLEPNADVLSSPSITTSLTDSGLLTGLAISATQAVIAEAGEGLAREVSMKQPRFMEAGAAIELGLCRSHPWYGWQTSRLWQHGVGFQSIVWTLPSELTNLKLGAYLTAVTGATSPTSHGECLARLAWAVCSARGQQVEEVSGSVELLAGLNFSSAVMEHAASWAQHLVNEDTTELRAESAAARAPGETMLAGPRVCALHEPSGSSSAHAPSGCGVCVPCGRWNALKHQSVSDDWVVA